VTVKPYCTLIVASIAGALAIPSATPARIAAAGPLQFTALVGSGYHFGNYCAAGTPAGVECIRFRGLVDVRGLGHVTAIYVKTAGDPRYGCPNITQFRTAELGVAGKGRIDLTMDGPVCGDYAPADASLTGTISGGTGPYAGASGTVTFKSSVYSPSTCMAGCSGGASDTWAVSLNVPGMDFDLTAPVFSGARSKTVRAPKGAKRARVKFAVKAVDDVDGALKAVCKPRSGSSFKLGRTKVVCTAQDSSANKATARFTVTVRKR
jgi:HYR domain-containing protein